LAAIDTSRADDPPWGSRRDVETFLIARGETTGRVHVDRGFALHLARLVIGAPAPVVRRPLGGTERGALAALLGELARSAGVPVSAIELTAPAPDAGHPPGVRVAVTVRAGGQTGWIDLVLPESWWQSPPQAEWREAHGALPLVLRVQAGETHLRHGDLASATAGDALVFEGLAALDGGGAAWACTIDLGGCTAPALWGADGGLRLAGGFLRSSLPGGTSLEQHGKDFATMPTTDTQPDHHATTPETPAGRTEAARLLGGAPVAVVAELTRLTISGDELLGLVAGAVVPLGVRRPASVTLTIAGRPWASGELVNVDGELAVRVVSIQR
jgi:type III secretion system YscQ/HrcQ family protein